MKYLLAGVTLGIVIVAISWALWNGLLANESNEMLKLQPVLSPSPIPTFSQKPITTIESAFDSDLWTATLSAERVTKLIATGDVLPARTVNYKTITYDDFTWAFANIAGLMSTGDITLINLETPLLASCPVTNSGMIFCGDSRHIEGLKFAGVDVANIANNHISNHGTVGVEETITLLNNASIQVSGLDKPAVVEHNGITFAFLGYNDIDIQPGVEHVETGDYEEDIRAASVLYDVVVVSFHWGTEYQAQPDLRSVEIAHRAIDAGADLIVGNHPHWIQPVELYNGKFITYAHGNTIFDQMWSDKTRQGVIGTYTFYDDSLIDVSFTPLVIEDYGQPRIAEGGEAKLILDDMYTQSKKRVN